MAWHECINGNYVLCFRIGERRFRRSLDTTSRAVADEDVLQVELNLAKLKRGYLTIPKGADVVSFLLSNGQVTEPLAVPDQIHQNDGVYPRSETLLRHRVLISSGISCEVRRIRRSCDNNGTCDQQASRHASA